MTKINIKIPNNFMNTAVTIDNHFIADTNDSNNFDTIKFPLPKGNWKIYKVSTNNIITLYKE